MERLGIDIGGSGVKGAIVDVDTGELKSPRVRRSTPARAAPAQIVEEIGVVARELGWRGPAGIGFPGIVLSGTIRSAVNLGPGWMGFDLGAALEEALGERPHVLNDADAAGLAEVRWGVAAGVPGTVLVLTVGTGIGSALFRDGILVPNTEFGHLEWRGKDAEKQLSEPARKRKALSWEKWSRRFDRFLGHLEFLLAPDLVVLGGGGVKAADRIRPHLAPHRARVEFARFGNRAGLIGAAAAEPPRRA